MKKNILLIITVVNLLFCLADTVRASEKKELPLSLEKASHLALKNNFDIQLAKYDAYMKENDLLGVESVFDTIISGSIGYTDNQLKSASAISGTKSLTTEYELSVEKKIPTGTTIETSLSHERDWTNSAFATVNPSHNTKAKIGITQEFGKNFFGMADRADVQITKIDIENAAYTSLEKIEDYLSRIQKAYWKLVLKKEELSIEKEMLKKAQDLYSSYEDKQKLGLVEMPQVLASRANVKQRESEIMAAENAVKIALNDLLYSLDLNSEKATIVPQDEFGIDTPEPAYLDSLKKALQFRRDYVRQRNEVKAKKIKLAMKKNNLWPEINLELTLTRNGLSEDYKEAFQSVTNEDNPQYYLGINFSFAFENSRAKGEFNKAKLEKLKHILKLKSVERKIVVEIKDNVVTLVSLINTKKNSDEIVELHEKKLEAEEKRFHAGRSDTDTLIRYHEDLLKAKLARARAIYDVKAGEIDLGLCENSLLNRYWENEL